ncbi:MAG: type II toxin-antitoxin system RelE/ParE family toxin [Bacteroidota bacterium]
MPKSVVLSASGAVKLSDLLEYLEQGWSKKVKDDFIKKLDRSVDRISKYPKSCPESKKYPGLFQCVVTKQTSLFYRVRKKEIEIITLFDTRQDPTKIKRSK